MTEPTVDDVDLQRRTLLAELAKAYYLQDVSKVDIGKAFGMSRFQVARLLDKARATGVVTIEVHDPLLPRSARERELAEALGIDEARIVGLDEENSGLRSEQFGAAVLTAMREAIRPGMTVGISWSRTLDRAARFLPALPPCSLVQLTGAFDVAGTGTLSRMLMQLDRRAGINTYPLYAPLVVDQPATARDVRRQPVVADALAHAEALDLAVVAIGAWLPGESAVWEKVPPEIRRACTKAGAVAEFSGNFLDTRGAVVSTPSTAESSPSDSHNSKPPAMSSASATEFAEQPQSRPPPQAARSPPSSSTPHSPPQSSRPASQLQGAPAQGAAGTPGGVSEASSDRLPGDAAP